MLFVIYTKYLDKQPTPHNSNKTYRSLDTAIKYGIATDAVLEYQTEDYAVLRPQHSSMEGLVFHIINVDAHVQNTITRSTQPG